MTPVDALKAGALLLVAGPLQLSVASSLEVAEGRPDLALVLVVAIALLRGPLFGSIAGFWAGLVLDAAALGTLGLSSLPLTLAGYWSGRFGEVASKGSAHPPLIAVAVATVGVALGSLVLHFMLGSAVAASYLLVAVALPSLAMNVLVAYPLYRLCRHLFPPAVGPRREVSLVA